MLAIYALLFLVSNVVGIIYLAEVEFKSVNERYEGELDVVGKWMKELLKLGDLTDLTENVFPCKRYGVREELMCLVRNVDRMGENGYVLPEVTRARRERFEWLSSLMKMRSWSECGSGLEISSNMLLAETRRNETCSIDKYACASPEVYFRVQLSAL